MLYTLYIYTPWSPIRARSPRNGAYKVFPTPWHPTHTTRSEPGLLDTQHFSNTTPCTASSPILPHRNKTSQTDHFGPIRKVEEQVKERIIQLRRESVIIAQNDIGLLHDHGNRRVTQDIAVMERDFSM